MDFPKVGKHSSYIPTTKKGNKNIAENFRPVSHIVEISKITEYAIFDQVFKHFNDNDLFHQNLHGFLPKHSTSTALIQLYDIWLDASEDHELSTALLLDLSSAFDLVDHSILLNKLKLYNFSEDSLRFFKSYLSNRKQKVQVESKESDAKEVGDIGVPQGAILGVLLFLIFQCDFPENFEDGISVLYADDTTDNVHDKDIDVLQNKIQEQADCSTQWIRDNKMICSGGKTKLLVVGTRELRWSKLVSKNKKLEVKVCGNTVVESSNEKLLGVIVSNDLTWHTHLYGNNEIGEKKLVGLIPQLSQRVGICKKLAKVLTSNQLAKC